MFNNKSSVSEILNSMNDNLLVKEAATKSAPMQKLASALEHLNAAAEIFDTVGLNKEAEITTKLLEKLAQMQQTAPVAPEADLKQKLMQALQPELAAQVKWNNFQVAKLGDGFDVSGEFQLSPQAEAAISAAMPIVNGKPMLFTNYLSMLAKKVDPRVRRAQFIRYTSSVK
jgi:hypothetical protein